ncbi:hypothetical protein, partial [Escherichia coli]
MLMYQTRRTYQDSN